MHIRSSEYLRELIADGDAAAARIASAEPAARAAASAAARRTSARLSARLDASPLAAETADAVDEREAQGRPPIDGGEALRQTPSGTGWAHVLKVDRMASQDVAAVEYANLLACFDVEPSVAVTFLDDPRAGLATLHAVVCRGLVAPEDIGRPRRTEQAVHDGAQGRALYHAPPAEAVDNLLDGLAAWLGGPAIEQPAIVVAGVVHERLLQWQPYEAGNGRVARAAARVVLRARRLDPEGVAVAERLPAADPVGYYGEVAATIRRRGDLGPWLERAGEAIVDGLAVAAALLGDAAGPPSRALAGVEGLGLAPGAPFTLAEYADRSAVPRAAATEELRALVAAGVVQREPGARGLRFRVRQR